MCMGEGDAMQSMHTTLHSVHPNKRTHTFLGAGVAFLAGGF